MRRAAIGSIAFFLLAPVGTGLVLPGLISGWDRPDAPPPLIVSIAGWTLATAGLAVVAACFVRFVGEGRGTPAPLAPTETLVVGGLYRYVRNPMYVGVIALILGQALALLALTLLPYAAAFTAGVTSFVRFYEEPALAAAHGDSFRRYRAAVPGWIPRLTPWSG